MIANYHTHTYRCHHAKGTEKGYIDTSIAGGIKYLGFSEHAPFIFPDGKESNHRMYMEDRFNYVSRLRRLREEYKDKIDIKIGLEMEYIPRHFKEMLSIAKDCGIEYLILGQHVLDDNDEMWSVRDVGDSEEVLDKYIELVCEAMKTGVFSYLAHPDVVRFKGDRELYLKKMRKICEVSLETGLPLEINFWGYHENKHYPVSDFWKMAGEMGCSVVYGCDAHTRDAAYDVNSIEKAEKMREEYNLNIVEIPRIIDIQKVDIDKF